MPSAAAPSEAPSDPHRLGPAIAPLGLLTKRSARVAFAVLGAVLDDGEVVELLVPGRFFGESGVLALTDRRLVLVNDREWKPDVERIALAPGLIVQGWQDDRSASLVFTTPGGRATTFDQIHERELAQRLATLVRSRIGAG